MLCLGPQEAQSLEDAECVNCGAAAYLQHNGHASSTELIAVLMVSNACRGESFLAQTESCTVMQRDDGALA